MKNHIVFAVPFFSAAVFAADVAVDLSSEAVRRERRRSSMEKFVASCRAAGQKGDVCWVGKATSMDKVMPRNNFDVAGADAFSLKLARGEYESVQILVAPALHDLKGAQVAVDGDLTRVESDDIAGILHNVAALVTLLSRQEGD